MSEFFTFSDLQHIIGVKFCLILFLLFGVIAIFKKWKPIIFLCVTSILAAVAYAIFINDLGLMFWGLAGDEITIAAMYETFAHGSLFSDFAYAHLPPFYPPLFFWIFALIGKFMDWNGVQIAKFASFISIALFPLIIYYIQAWYWKPFGFTQGQGDKRDIIASNKIMWMLAPLIVWVFVDPDAMILKPYEVITASLSILWIVFLLRDLKNKNYSWKRLLCYGITGGLLFMMYYLWLVIGAIAIALSGLFVAKKDQLWFYEKLILTAILVLIVASPYLIPLILSYQKYGAENWQFILMYAKSIAYHAQMFEYFSWRGILMLLGFVSLLFFWKKTFIRSLLFIFIASYVWQAMGFATIFFFETPIQESKGFYFINRTVLAFALSYGIVWIWNYLDRKNLQFNWRQSIAVIGLVFLSTQMIFGFFADDPVAQIRRVESRGPRKTIVELIGFLQKDEKQDKRILTLHAGISELHAFLPMNAFIYFNQHNSHPASNFSARKAYVDWLATASSPEEFYILASDTWFGSIDRLVLFKKPESDFYPVYFHLDNFPNGAKDEQVHIKKNLIARPYFELVFENDEFVVWDRSDLEE